MWCDWSENIVWFPTVLVFLATTLAYVINPDLSQNKAFLVPVMLVIFWAVTASSLAGSLKSARWTGVGVIIGTAVPTAAIIALGLWWTGTGRHSQIPFHPAAVIPAWHGLASLVYAAGIVVAFAGMEIGGFYSHVTRNLTRTYPRAVLIAAATVAGLSILGSVAIAMVVPAKQIQLANLLLDAHRAGRPDLPGHVLPDVLLRHPAPHHQARRPPPVQDPGGKPGLALIAGLGIAGALFTFFLGFIPATHLSTPGTIAYVTVMAVGMIAIVGTPFLLHRGPALKADTKVDPNLT